MADLHETAKALVAEGKGILAADESSGTIKKRFDSIDVESTEENRRAYRDLLFTTPGAEEFISGVILYDETIRQSSADGTPFPKLLENKGIIPGIKVELGARFTKWRAVINIGPGRPSEYAIWTNAHALARFAALSQEAGLVPIVEPEVLMDGEHTIDESYRVTERTLRALYTELFDQRVEREGSLLKTNMVVSGYDSSDQADVDTAAARLNAMNQRGPHPWELSFSYGRALQAPALKAWDGDSANVEAAQQAYYRRAKFNGAARTGSYAPDWEKEEALA